MSRKPPAIPEPTRSIESIYETIVALKQTVEVLAGQRGTNVTTGVTWQDLVDLELIAADQIPS